MKLKSLPKAPLIALVRTSLAREREFYTRYRELSTDIASSPADMTPRVLRGELLLERRDDARAREDFEAALELTGELDRRAGWLLQEQVMRDRALYGLEIATRRLPPPGEPATNVEA